MTAIIRPIGSVVVTLELLRNILLEGSVGFSQSDFNGTGNREDNLTTTGLGGRYLINRNLYTDVNYGFENRDSNENTADYVRHMIMLRLGIHL